MELSNQEVELIQSVQQNYYNGVRDLIEKGVNVDIKSPKGDGLLHIAAGAGNVKIIPLLVAGGINARAINDDGMTALHTAADNLQRSSIMILCEKCSIDPTVKDKQGMTAQDYMKKKRRTEIDFSTRVNSIASLLRRYEYQYKYGEKVPATYDTDDTKISDSISGRASGALFSDMQRFKRDNPEATAEQEKDKTEEVTKYYKESHSFQKKTASDVFDTIEANKRLHDIMGDFFKDFDDSLLWKIEDKIKEHLFFDEEHQAKKVNFLKRHLDKFMDGLSQKSDQ